MKERAEKISVMNPLSLRNTIGAELVEMFDANNVVDYETKLGVKNLKLKEKLSDKTLIRAADILGNKDLYAYLYDFQSRYLSEKPVYKKNYEKAKRAYKRLKNVLPMLRGEFTEGYDQLDDIIDFFGVDSEDEIFEQCEHSAALFRKQNNIKVNPINLCAWLRRGEIDFERMVLPNYDRQGLMNWIDSKVWEDSIEDVSYFKSLPDELSKFGVGLVLVPSLPNTVYGAIRWRNGNPFIQISDRYRDLATCWFTLFHEFGHAFNDEGGEVYEGKLNEKDDVLSQSERRANKYANEYLFHGDDLRKSVFKRKKEGKTMTANVLATEFNVLPIFASYWLLKAQYMPTLQRKIYIDFVEQYQ